MQRILGAFKLNPYEQLGMRNEAPVEEVRRQYRKVRREGCECAVCVCARGGGRGGGGHRSRRWPSGRSARPGSRLAIASAAAAVARAHQAVSGGLLAFIAAGVPARRVSPGCLPHPALPGRCR